ncbi:MAG: hypothetical protein IH955_09820 [Chloroflexi bacterium]|nr:hypothetical protein [Chloroflexota bacterium]
MAPGRWAGILWLASLPAFYQWAGLAMMDTALWSAALHLFFVICLNAARGRATHGWAIVAGVVGLVLSRPDSTLVVPATLLVLVITFGLTPSVRRTVIATLGAGVPVILGLTLVRLAYFGYPLPNTYYTKVSPDLAYRLAGQAAYLGPTAYVTLSPHAWASFTWSFQIAGQSAGEPGPLDLSSFDRHQMRLRVGYSF